LKPNYLQGALAALCLTLAAAGARADVKRPISPEDWYRFQTVSDPRVSPDGATVAYLVTRFDRDADESRAELYSVAWSGGEPRQLTRGESVSDPRFSPDGRYLSFLSARPADAPSELWLLDRQGGEARPVSHVTGDIVGYDWSPDGRHVVLLIASADETDADAKKSAKTPRPIVIDAFHFKQDQEGYVPAGRRSHLALLDTASGTVVPLTSDRDRTESAPAFSPDGKEIAFVSHRVGGPADVGRDDIEVIAAAAGAAPRLIVSVAQASAQSLAFSPDGRLISLFVGVELKYQAYVADRLAVVDVATGKLRYLADGLDRLVKSAHFAADGQSILGAIEDDGYQYPAAISVATGAVTRLASRVVVLDLATAHGHTAVLASSDTAPPELFAFEDGRLRSLTQHNTALFREFALGAVEDIAFKSRDGTEVHGQLVKPVGYRAGERYPTILWIHGGPNGQDDHSLELAGYGPPLERQLFASHGYAVLAINYRGSSGRGSAYARSIWADWGHKEVEDLRAGVDYAIAQGIADPKRLGIGGWSYGGILTDYTIASDPRFRAAISGAGSANQISMYGSDEYVVQYNAELGPPWRDPALWMKVSYPFFHADRIRTPTLFMGGDKDFNVPLAGGEQMYQALRTLGVPTVLVVYPGEFHVFTRPSFLVDRSGRFLDWMAKYLAPAP